MTVLNGIEEPSSQTADVWVRLDGWVDGWMVKNTSSEFIWVSIDKVLAECKNIGDQIFPESEVAPFILFILLLNAICHTCNTENPHPLYWLFP